jgi:hypothetical protein
MKNIENTKTAIRILEQVWQHLMENIDDLPSVQFVLETNDSKRYGLFQAAGWHYSSSAGHIVGIRLDLLSDVNLLLAVLLHEGVHAINYSRGVQDVRNEYHNKHFKKLAIELGLLVEFRNTRHGFTNTYFDVALKQRYDNAYSTLAENFNISIAQPKIQKGKLPKSGHVILFCKCTPKRRISMTPANYSLGTVTCSICKFPFTTR